MSLLERQITRRELLSGALGLFGATILGCESEKEVIDRTLKIPNNKTVHLEVAEGINPIDGVKISDVYFYSNAQEDITWLSVVFDRKVGAAFSRFSLYLAPPENATDISQKEHWLGEADEKGVADNSYLNAFSHLLGYLGDNAEEVISYKSVMVPLKRPQNEEPHLLLYTKFDRENEVINDVIQTKLSFEQPLPKRRT